jgi:hypothetical protein
MNNLNGIKRLLKLVLAVAVIFLVVKWCSSNFGSVIKLPGGMGESTNTESSNNDSGGWFSPRDTKNEATTNKDLEEEVKELERELGIGTNKGKSTTNTTTTTTTTTTPKTSTTPLSFKGIPMTGTLTAFGNELVKAGFQNAGNGTYTGNFAGYSGCKVTPSGSNPVREVRVDFPVISDWDALEKAYDSLQASLTEKYGIQPQTSANSNVAVYDLPNGTITLDADVKDKSTWHVILKYTNPLTTTSTGTLGRNPIDDL